MMTARYAGFLQRSLPPFWPTADRAMVLAALQAARRDRRAAAAGGRAGAARVDRRGPGTPWATPTAARMPWRRSPSSARSPRTRPRRSRPRTAVTHGHAWTEQEDEELRDGIELGLHPRRARRVDGAAGRGRLRPPRRARPRGRQRPDPHLRLRARFEVISWPPGPADHLEPAESTSSRGVFWSPGPADAQPATAHASRGDVGASGTSGSPRAGDSPRESR